MRFNKISRLCIISEIIAAGYDALYKILIYLMLSKYFEPLTKNVCKKTKRDPRNQRSRSTVTRSRCWS